jgi:tRNA (guanine37-N1)-methyltransferase
MFFDIITIFPEFFDGPLSYGMIFQAQKRGLVDIAVHDLREYTSDRHKTVDDRPFGGGAGMVLKPEPLFRAVRNVRAKRGEYGRVVLLTPQGKPFDQRLAVTFSSLSHLILLCGRYEGVDERVNEHLADEEISIGDYVLSGGELAACVLVDAVTRLLPGVLNNDSSALIESFSCADYPLLDYPHYTRPEDFEGQRVPEVLLSGDHAKVRLWRRRKALEKTLKNRPDLLEYSALSEDDKQLLRLEFDSAGRSPEVKS